MKEKRADLHVHTTYSDGSFTPAEVVNYAKRIGLGCIAIADHDSVKGIDEALAAGESLGVEIIPAVEISSEEEARELHILGYYIDYKDENLVATLKQIREDRRKRLAKMVDSLNRHGFNIDMNELLAYIGDVSASRLHIARYMEAKNLVSSWRDSFKKYIGDNGPCYVAGFRLSAKEAIDLIRSAGGISVIAHPGLSNLETDGVLAKLIGQGIEGIEAFHSDHSPSLSKKLERYAQEHSLLITGGSDCHGKGKGKILMGTVTIPYSYVEALKKRKNE